MSFSTILSLDPAFLSMVDSALTLADIAAVEAISPDVCAAVHSSAKWLHVAVKYLPKFKFGHELFLEPIFEIKAMLRIIRDVSVADDQVIRLANRAIAASFVNAAQKALASARENKKYKAQVLATTFEWDLDEDCPAESLCKLDSASDESATLIHEVNPEGFDEDDLESQYMTTGVELEDGTEKLDVDLSDSAYFNFHGKPLAMTLGWSEDSCSLIIELGYSEFEDQFREPAEKKFDVDVFAVGACGISARSVRTVIGGHCGECILDASSDPRAAKSGLLTLCCIREAPLSWKDWKLPFVNVQPGRTYNVWQMSPALCALNLEPVNAVREGVLP